MKVRFAHVLPVELRNPAHVRGLVLAGLYGFFLLTQLFTFELFADITSGYQMPGGVVTAILLATLIPIAETLALPFLVGMKLPRRLAHVSRVATIVVPSLWLVIALWTSITGNVFGNVGIFGATLPTVNGWWFIVFAALLLWAAILVRRDLYRPD